MMNVCHIYKNLPIFGHVEWLDSIPFKREVTALIFLTVSAIHPRIAFINRFINKSSIIIIRYCHETTGIKECNYHLYTV